MTPFTMTPFTGRLETVASATDTFTYGYAYDQTAADPEAEPPVPAGARVGSATGAKQDFMPYTLTRSGSRVLQTLRTYEATRDVLTTIQNNAGGTTRSSYTYNVNHLGQREDVTTSGSAFGGNPADWDWTYDDLGQVKSADSASFDRSYQYDLIGNRRRAANSLVLPTSDNYAANALNQYTLAAGVALPVPANDPDGNLLDDGGVNHTAGTARLYVWDAENRLLAVKDKTSGNTLVSHAYDASSRRICSTASATITYYLHDAWNVIAEYVKPASGNAALSRTRVWGLDLSGSLQGAGGVGGLLAETIATGGNAGTYYSTFDGNGNISEYLDNAGTVAAHYEYDPFGNLTVSTGTLAAEFNYRFSTKPLEPISGWYYYTYRYYDPLTGRWPSRDPIEERGGANLYGFVGNDGIGRWDRLGLCGYFFSPGQNPAGCPTPPPGPHSGQDDGIPTMADHTAGHDPNEYLGEEDWFESNHADLIQKMKDFARVEISVLVDCDTRPERVDGYTRSHDFGDLTLGGVSFQTESVEIEWDSNDWSWTATLWIDDKLGVDYRDSGYEFTLTFFGAPLIAPPVPVERARWEISDDGCCDN